MLDPEQHGVLRHEGTQVQLGREVIEILCFDGHEAADTCAPEAFLE